MAQEELPPPMNKEVAEQALTEIRLFSGRAYGDAALHSTADGKEESLESMLSAVNDNFKGSKTDKLLDAAFGELESLVRTRITAEQKPEEQEAAINESLKKVRVLQQQIHAAIRERELPSECAESFNSGLAIATSSQPRQKWVNAVEARNAATGKGNPDL